MSHPTTTWPLTEAVPPAPPAVGPTTPTAPSIAPFSVLNQFGHGVIHPFRRNRTGDFQNEFGVALIKSNVSQILGTFAASEIAQGELPWRPNFGSVLYLLRHQPNNDSAQSLARIYVVEALQRWEPRVKVTDVRVSREDTKLILNVRFNFVDPTTGNTVFQDLEASIVI